MHSSNCCTPSAMTHGTTSLILFFDRRAGGQLNSGAVRAPAQAVEAANMMNYYTADEYGAHCMVDGTAAGFSHGQGQPACCKVQTGSGGTDMGIYRCRGPNEGVTLLYERSNPVRPKTRLCGARSDVSGRRAAGVRALVPGEIARQCKRLAAAIHIAHISPLCPAATHSNSPSRLDPKMEGMRSTRRWAGAMRHRSGLCAPGI